MYAPPSSSRSQTPTNACLQNSADNDFLLFFHKRFLTFFFYKIRRSKKRERRQNVALDVLGVDVRVSDRRQLADDFFQQSGRTSRAPGKRDSSKQRGEGGEQTNKKISNVTTIRTGL